MEEQLISFETAKLAKEVGFNIPTLHYYYFYEDNKENRRLKYPIGTAELISNAVSGMSNKTATDAGFRGADTDEYLHYNITLEQHYIDISKFPAHKVMYQAPTQSLLQKWLRETYNFNIEVKTPDGKKGVWLYEIHQVHGFGNYSKLYNAYTSFEDALEGGLQETLSRLDELIKLKRK